jgi:hypothetical protein
MRRVLALLAITQAGCSALGLTIQIPECEDHAACAELNELAGHAETDCFRYVCIGSPRRTCTEAYADLDNDGFPAARCAGDTTGPGCDANTCNDCDDGDARANGDASEVCDGVDNDCNLVVDDVPAAGEPASDSTLVSNTMRVDFASYGGALPGTGVEPIVFGAASAFMNLPGREGEAEAAQPFASALANLLARNENTVIPNRCATSSGRTTDPYPTAGAMPNMPNADNTCVENIDCTNDVFCDGFEMCVHPYTDPRHDLPNGCREGFQAIEIPCGDSEFCHESSDECELLSEGACSFAALAVAETRRADGAGRWIGIGVQTKQCDADPLQNEGVVRVGYFTESETRTNFDPGRSLLQRGDLTRSSSFRGIDLDAGGCTGASRTGMPTGAHSPAIGALPADAGAARGRPQALAAWIGAPENSAGPVEIIGVWHEQFGGTPATTVEWVNATGSSVPERLPIPALGDVAPVVAPFVGQSSAGYVVGYGSSDGVVLRYVPSFGDPPDTGPGPTFAIDPPQPPSYRDRRESPPIAELGTDTTLAATGGARHVDLAISSASGDTAQIGVTWIDDTGVRFAIFELDAAAGTIGAPASAEMVDPPGAEQVSIAFAETGLVLEGYQGTSGVADASTLGGWLVAWTTDTETLGARFTILDGSRLVPETMHFGAALARIDVYVARTLDAEGVLRPLPRLAYHDSSAQQFRTFDAFCGPP